MSDLKDNRIYRTKADHDEVQAMQSTIQQLAEALRNINPVLFNAWNRVHCLPRETDSVLASHIEGAQRTIKQALTAAEPYLKEEK